MILPTYRKILYGLALIGIITMIIMPDMVMGLLFELVHFFFEFLFISFEWLELTLDTLVEQLFHTELHQTQVIVFYLIIVITAFPFYYLWRMLRRLLFQLKESLDVVHEAWMLYKTRAIHYWLDLPLINKSKLIAVFAGFIYLASFLFF